MQTISIGHLFKSTVCVVTKHVCASIVKLLLPEYIQVPTGAALKEVVEGFKTDHSFPQCAGAVDGSHIPIVSPQECPADYYNRKGWHSIILQGNSGSSRSIYGCICWMAGSGS